MSDNNTPLLEIKDLVVSFGTGRRKKEVLHRISFNIREGECVGLVSTKIGRASCRERV